MTKRKLKVAEKATVSKKKQNNETYPIHIVGRHVHITQAMKDYALKKVSKLEHYGNRIIDVTVVIDIQKLQHRCDIVMKYGSTTFKSHAATTDMYVSIDFAVDKLQAQLTRYNSRLHQYHKKAASMEDALETIYGAEEADEINEEIEAETRKKKEKESTVYSQIVKIETQPIKILTDQEAVRSMNVSVMPVMVFRDEMTRKLKVIYRRQDGNFGVLEPETVF